MASLARSSTVSGAGGALSGGAAAGTGSVLAPVGGVAPARLRPFWLRVLRRVAVPPSISLSSALV
ncbi:MAG: hypothetical protein QOG45_3005 [Chloroflexota bacterium]|jgi:hypothetical protein|nr:hypothetical protein [Chloroflexota bacterium]